MTDRVLLTGISGWIAKHIAIELLNAGYEVLGTVRNQRSLEKTKKTLSEYVSTDKLSIGACFLIVSLVCSIKVLFLILPKTPYPAFSNSIAICFAIHPLIPVNNTLSVIIFILLFVISFNLELVR